MAVSCIDTNQCVNTYGMNFCDLLPNVRFSYQCYDYVTLMNSCQINRQCEQYNSATTCQPGTNYQMQCLCKSNFELHYDIYGTPNCREIPKPETVNYLAIATGILMVIVLFAIVGLVAYILFIRK